MLVHSRPLSSPLLSSPLLSPHAHECTTHVHRAPPLPVSSVFLFPLPSSLSRLPSPVFPLPSSLSCRNPDQSKHLETATMMIHGMWIDFVNLRAEEYAHDSRIPHTIEFGTAEEDALRRDLTINSMFYNISTEQVEDPTGRGISDLNGGIIRTPLPPHQTFLDDPLRVLRAVRFAARFGFSLDEELRAAAASEEVRTALGNKVSKERIGKEVELMLKSRDPYAAISLVVDLNLFPIVFPLPHAPSHTADVPPDDELPGLCEASFAATCTRLHQWEKHLPQALIDHSSDLSVGLLLAALLMPLRHAHYLDRKKKEVPFAQHIVLDSLKLKRAYADMVVLLHAAAEDFTALAPLLAREGAEAAVGGGGETARALTLITLPHEEFQDNPRVLTGKLLRKVKACWPSAVLLASTLPPLNFSAMVRPVSDLWKHVNKVTSDANVVSATCKHCGEAVTANATRIKEHIYGTPFNKLKNVTMCESNPAKLLREEAERERSSTVGCSNRASSSSNELQPVRRARQRDIRDMADDLARGRLDYLWAAVVAENDLAFNVSKSKALQAFVDAAVIYAKPYTLPTPYKVSGPLLEKLKADTEDLVRPIKDSWSISGCSLSVDGWTCLKSRGMVCVIAQNDTAPVIVDIVDSKTAKKTGEYLAALIRKAICTVGERKVIQVVMDNASNNKRAADMLREGFPQVFFTNCAAHVLDLMLHDMGNIRVVKRVLTQVHRVVMMVKGSASAVVLFREVFSNLSLVRPGATRFGTQVIMIGRFLEVKRALRAMVISEEWEEVAVARTEEGRAVRTLLLDDFFWDLVTAVHRLMTPVYGVLRVVDKRSLIMGEIYGRMIDATVQTNEAAEAAGKHYNAVAEIFVKRPTLLVAKDKATFFTSIKAIVAKRWDGQLHNALHALGWLLNPRNQYVGAVRNDREIRLGADEVIQARGVDVAQRTLLHAQLAQFHKGEGQLGSDDARLAATTLVEGGRLTDAEWWWMYGGEVAALQELAVMTLSQPVTSSEVERYFTALARVQRRDRNRLAATKMTDVTYVAFTRRARDAFDRRQGVREKLYRDLSNGTLKEGCTIAPDDVLVDLNVFSTPSLPGLDGVWDTKPILNGRDVVAALELKKGDPRTGCWMDRVMEWQLASPNNGSTEELSHSRSYHKPKRVKNSTLEQSPQTTQLSPFSGRPEAPAAMLAIFQKSIGEAPQELMAPKLNRSASMSGRLDAKEILHGFKKAHPGAVLMQFDEQHAIAYTHDMQDFLMPRQFAACDDVFCAFAGNIENLAQLRQRYGLDRHVSEVNLIIEAYKTLRDRRPYPPDQVIADLAGAFAFVLYDNKAKKVFVAHDAQGKVPLYWGKCLDDGVLAFSDDPAVLKAGTGSSFAPFPLGCFYSSDGGLRSFTDPEKQLKAIQHVDSQGELCGATFKVDSHQDLTQLPLDSKDDSGRGWS
ncbi:unnamed protein product [Closterium sp. Yama58-4]|nr:unnamed protein product [Closterium sp. Yama58-4]